MKRILFIVTKSENGGAQKWVSEQIEVLSDTFECYLATDKNGWLTENTFTKANFLDIRIRGKLSILYLFKLCKFIKDNDIELVVSSSANAGLYSRLCKMFCKVKVAYVAHGWSAIYNGGRLKYLYILIERFLSIFSDSILCVSNSDYMKAKNIIRVDQRKLKTICNKIYPIKSYPSSNNFDDEATKILCVSRLQAPKRVDLLLDSVRDLDMTLHIVGGGPLRSQLENLKPDNVHFLGAIDGFTNFDQYDIFCLISDSEGLPLSGIEALSAGLPLILSNVGGCSELIDANGVLVENDVESIRTGFKCVIENKREYSKNSVELFSKKFDLSKNRYDYIEYYSDVIDTNNSI